MARERANITLKPGYTERVDEVREDQVVEPGRTEIVYAALDLFFEEHGYEPVED